MLKLKKHKYLRPKQPSLPYLCTPLKCTEMSLFTARHCFRISLASCALLHSTVGGEGSHIHKIVEILLRQRNGRRATSRGGLFAERCAGVRSLTIKLDAIARTLGNTHTPPSPSGRSLYLSRTEIMAFNTVNCGCVKAVLGSRSGIMVPTCHVREGREGERAWAL